MTTQRKYTDEQIVAILQEHQGGVTAKEIIRRHGIALGTFYRWKRKYSGLGSRQRPPRPTTATACARSRPMSSG